MILILDALAKPKCAAGGRAEMNGSFRLSKDATSGSTANTNATDASTMLWLFVLFPLNLS